MTMLTFSFYLFSIVAVVAGLMVVTARNPVHSVLWLILTFFAAAGLFVLLGAEFVAMLLLIVYVGAVAVLFLFVVMMLDVDFAELKSEMVKYMPVGLLIGLVIVMQLAIAFGSWETAPGAADARLAVTPTPEVVQNTAALGHLIYDQYVYLFMASSLVLLVAMIGAIVLTLRHRTNVKRQDVVKQMMRDPATAIEIRDVKPGQGL